MKRILFWPSSTILLLGILVLPACGQDTVESVIADCSGHIPREKVDSCLERARVFDETNPSPDLQALEAQLQQRALHHEEAQGAPPPGYDPNQPPPGYDPNQGPPPDYNQNEGPPPPDYDADQPSQGDTDEEQDDEGADQPSPPGHQPPPAHGYRQQPHDYGDQSPPPEGPRGDVSPPDDRTGPGDLMPPDEGPQGPPPDNIPPPDDSETQGPGQ